jgi:hypothetical protein
MIAASAPCGDSFETSGRGNGVESISACCTVARGGDKSFGAVEGGLKALSNKVKPPNPSDNIDKITKPAPIGLLKKLVLGRVWRQQYLYFLPLPHGHSAFRSVSTRFISTSDSRISSILNGSSWQSPFARIPAKLGGRLCASRLRFEPRRGFV